MSDNRPARRNSPEFKVKPQMSNLVAEEQLCSALMADIGTYGEIQSLVSSKEFDHVKPRAIMEAAEECMNAATARATTRANIAERLQAKGLLDTVVTVDYLQKLDDAGFDYVIKEARNNANLIRAHAQRRNLAKRYRNAAEQIETEPDRYIQIVGDVAQETTAEISNTNEEYDPTPAEWYDQRTENDVVKPGAPSYLHRFNEWNLGILPATETAINGPPKDGRKTTLVANILLRPLIEKIPIIWVTVDGQKQNVFDRFAAMLSVYWLVLRNQEDPEKYPRYISHKGEDAFDQWEIKIRGVSKMWRSDQQNKAVEWARKVVLDSKLRVYDVKAGILELPRILSYLQRDATITFRDDEYRAFVLDYVQEIEAGSDGSKGWQHSDFEQVMKRCSAATKIHGLTSFYISQPNEASLQGKGGKSSGAKGGGKLLQVVDTWLTTEYDNENEPNKLGLVQQRARYGGFAREDYEIHPPSGLILNPNAGQKVRVYQPEGY